MLNNILTDDLDDWSQHKLPDFVTKLIGDSFLFQASYGLTANCLLYFIHCYWKWFWALLTTLLNLLIRFQIKGLRIWKMQLLDEQHILIKYASEEVVTLRSSEPNAQVGPVCYDHKLSTKPSEECCFLVLSSVVPLVHNSYCLAPKYNLYVLINLGQGGVKYVSKSFLECNYRI